MAIVGSSKIRNWKRLRFPAVSIAYGAPIRFAVEPEPSRERQQEVADAIFDEIKTLYAELNRRGRHGATAPLAGARDQ